VCQFRLSSRAALWLVLAALALPGFSARAAESKRVEIQVRSIDLKEAAKVSFARDIKPLLVSDCDECHSADDHKGAFDISSVATLTKGGKKGGAGIVPSKPDESSIVKYIRGLADGPQMPKGEPPLSEAEVHLIRSWIAAGAVDDSTQVAALAAPKPAGTNASSALPSAETQNLLNAFIFGSDKMQQFAARRALRLALVPPAPAPPKVHGPTFNEIDQFVAAQWEAAGLPEAREAPPLCDDATFIRRVSLDLIGMIPTAEASRQFVADRTPDKRLALIDALLARNEDYAANWTPFWEEALASQQTVGGVATHGDYTDFLYDSFVKNKPYDLMVAELLDPTVPGHKDANVAVANGKTNVNGFVRNQTQNDTIQTAANTAQVFLGTGMKCASCHSHFLNKEWPQTRFTAFAGLFAEKDLELVRCEVHSGRYIPAAFPFAAPDAPATAPPDLEGRLHYMTTLLIDPSNPRFAKTIVNRLWKRYLGLGLFEPVDDFRLDRPASNPALLDWLADDFMRHGYDLKHAIRLILASRTYQSRYNPALEDHFDTQKPEAPRYARSPSLRRLTAEQFIDSLRQATAAKREGTRLFRSIASTALTRALARPATHNEISTGRSDDVAVVQSLELLNGTELRQMVYDGEILDTLASSADRQKVVNELYWTVLNRPPTSRELALGLDCLPGKSTAAAPPKEEELVWVDDQLPPGAQPNGESWQWVSNSAGPVFSGTRSHTLNTNGNAEQHYFTGAQPLVCGERDRLFTYVFIDSNNPPKEIMLQWHQDNWDHRAFWGADEIPFGTKDQPSRLPMGPLPKAGEWVRLEVPVAKLRLDPASGIDGWSFDQQGGKVYWDKSGITHVWRDPATEPLGDMLWAMVVSPEFQFIR
jgi:hypothetical protein